MDEDEFNGLVEVKKVFPSLIKEMPSHITAIPGYKELNEGLKKDEEGKHSEAMEFYTRSGKLGNKAAFLNMGNCYIFGKGVYSGFWFWTEEKPDWRKSIEMYEKCGKIGDDELGWMRELSNDRYVCGKKLSLNSLFLLIENHTFSCYYCFYVCVFML